MFVELRLFRFDLLLLLSQLSLIAGGTVVFTSVIDQIALIPHLLFTAVAIIQMYYKLWRLWAVFFPFLHADNDRGDHKRQLDQHHEPRHIIVFCFQGEEHCSKADDQRKDAVMESREAAENVFLVRLLRHSVADQRHDRADG